MRVASRMRPEIRLGRYDQLVMFVWDDVATAATWADNASIWLARRSDGVTVLVGAAPDYGAHEYGAGTASAPTGVGVR